MVIESAVTPCADAPALFPTNFGMHGIWWLMMSVWTSPPAAHLPLSPAVGRPRLSTACDAACGVSAPPDAPPLAWATAPCAGVAPGARCTCDVGVAAPPVGPA